MKQNKEMSDSELLDYFARHIKVGASIAFDFDGGLGPNQFTDNKRSILDYSLTEKMRGWTEMKPFPNAIPIVNVLFNQGFKVVIVTGREEKFRRVSEIWLKVYGFQYSQLIMIPKAWQTYGEYYQFKMDTIQSIQPVLVIDDDFDLLVSISQVLRIKVYLIALQCAVRCKARPIVCESSAIRVTGL